MVELKLSFITMDAPRGRTLEHRVHADQLLVELAAQCLDVLLSLEVRVDPVGQREPSLAAWDRQAESGKVVELPEGPRERGLAPVVGPADHEHPLGSVEVEVVAYHLMAI